MSSVLYKNCSTVVDKYGTVALISLHAVNKLPLIFFPMHTQAYMDSYHFIHEVERLRTTLNALLLSTVMG